MIFKVLFSFWNVALLSYIFQAQGSPVDFDRPRNFHLPSNTNPEPSNLTSLNVEVREKYVHSKIYFRSNLEAFSQYFYNGTGDSEKIKQRTVDASVRVFNRYIERKNLFMNVECTFGGDYEKFKNTKYYKGINLKTLGGVKFVIVDCVFKLTRTDIDIVYLKSDKDEEVKLLSTTKTQDTFRRGQIKLTQVNQYKEQNLNIAVYISSTEYHQQTSMVKVAAIYARKYGETWLRQTRTGGFRQASLSTCTFISTKSQNSNLHFLFKCSIEGALLTNGIVGVSNQLMGSFSNRIKDSSVNMDPSIKSLNLPTSLPVRQDKRRSGFLVKRSEQVGKIEMYYTTAVVYLSMDEGTENRQVTDAVKLDATIRGERLVKANLWGTSKTVRERCQFIKKRRKYGRHVLEVSCPLHASNST